MRKIAEEREMQLAELQQLAALDGGEIDKETDKRTVELAEKEDNFIIDSRLAFHFIPSAIKIFLTVKPEVAAERIFGDVQKQRRGQEQDIHNLDDAIKSVKDRLARDISRYKQHYNIDYVAKENYDLIVDTSNKTPEKIVKEIVEFVKNHW